MGYDETGTPEDFVSIKDDIDIQGPRAFRALANTLLFFLHVEAGRQQLVGS